MALSISFVQRIVNAAATASAFIWNGVATFNASATFTSTLNWVKVTSGSTARLHLRERAGGASNTTTSLYVVDPGSQTASNYSLNITANGDSLQTNANTSQIYRLADTEVFRIQNNRMSVRGLATPTSTLQVNGSVSFVNTGKTADYTLTVDDHTVEWTGSANCTATLPSPVGISGREYVLCNFGTGLITITGTGISKVLNYTGHTVRVKSNGTVWRIIADNNLGHYSEAAPVSGATYQNNKLVGAAGIDLVIQNQLIFQPPFTFNSATGTISIPVTAGDQIYVSFR